MNTTHCNNRKPMIDPSDAVMLLIDHQSGLFQLVEDMPMTALRRNAAALAWAATLAKLPVITTASVPQGPNGPLIPEISKYAPHARYVARTGQINAWDNPDFVNAVKETRKNQLIIAGTLTSVCMALPAISAIADGYQVFTVIDATFFSPSDGKSSSSVVVKEARLSRLNFSNLAARVICMDFNVFAAPE